MGHSHDHAHVGPSTGQRRLWPMVASVVLIAGFFVVELVVGIISNSLALIADAGHMATDVVALLMGMTALLMARHGSTTARRSFGWHRAEVFSAIVNAVLLIAVGAYVLYEAVERIGKDPHVPGLTLIVVALIGLAVNVVAMLLLRADAKESIAVRGAYLEVLADAVGSVGVLVAGIFALITGSGYADIVVAVLIALWVVPRAVRLAADALRILNQQAPKHVDVEGVAAQLAQIPGVRDVHDLHIWTLTTGMDVATVHIASAAADGESVLAQAQQILTAHGLEHATVQVEGDQGCGDSELSW
ncbi:MAG TPA: cation diffusion facilitator family transporter [Gordonia sp. (in: high G+C Gram-positive bacteria)]|uniref:cation diffusion facilitator family transporter n=1 Tax=unclassified Gordonia (in: high G+C Gram-positive bacteria) TaxID=2657482 RepID=UPI000F91A6C0|nr:MULTISPECIES: cation diffusion facilitator family transporter [unclassified Gordonia (in: high G+C Gram-positive bacteria)]RUP41197.1 MAG: cation transporter [Gordonia sp. (in: high G+C Gram-positive bacteria)]HNP55608.1 cation diffusion facilitator family transporter [Gordonia sp. (in: high G+C Gram-positive bacteria)]HRC50509.1 cation diffusion facilitator family transporter [Gordonia sp. (in: high G+C Gram-positive bacteria)]